MDVALGRLLNSTVGTTSYKPLDKIILGNVRLIGSDSVLFTYDREWVQGDSSIYAYGQWGVKTSSFIKFDTAGTVRFVTTQRSELAVAKSYTIRVYDANDTVIATYSADVPSGTTAEISVNINVTAGSKYKFSCACPATQNLPAKSLNICATPVPNANASIA